MNRDQAQTSRDRSAKERGNGAGLAGTALRETSPPPEPRAAYPEPSPSIEEHLALIRGKTFFASDRRGDLAPPGAPHVGLFLDDTRYLSSLKLRVNGSCPIVLSSTTEAGAYLNRIEMAVKGVLKTPGLDFPINSLYLRREQVLEPHAFYDLLHLRAFQMEPVHLTVELECDADFMDIFQVRGMIRGRNGQYFQPIVRDSSLEFVYEGLDHRERSTLIRFHPTPTSIHGKTACWKLDMSPLGTERIGAAIIPSLGSRQGNTHRHWEVGSEPAGPELHGLDADLDTRLCGLRTEFETWQKDCTQFHSDNDIFDAMLHTSAQDFYALRIPAANGSRQSSAIAAGVPWFAALFGRDSIIASFETLGLNPGLARGTLRTLSATQGKKRCDDNDEEPGKIVHEIRNGEMAATREIAFGRNYGSVDATPLFIILLGEYFRWSGDKKFLREMEPALTAAVNWILEYGDLDGDGLIEYERKGSKGLFNQGWKDSGDANLHSDGTIAEPPIALVEVQGYAAAALSSAAVLLRVLNGENSKQSNASPARLSERAGQLRRLISARFWMESYGYYAMALDRNKRPLSVISSNPGHLLFANALPRGRAKQVTERLISPGLFSGWGVRTLSRDEPTFNPMSYHRGSVWPHDNALIAYGMAGYGLRQESARIAAALYDAALYFRGYRLPELFCGVERRRHDEPVQYPVSCSPQAWASGAPYLLMRATLGFRVDASTHDLKIVNPHLPPFLNRLEVKNMRIGNSHVSLEFLRHGKRTFCNLSDVEGDDLSISVVYR